MNMRTFILSIFTIITFSCFAQSDVYLNINHKLGAEDFEFNMASENNLNNDFNVDRIEYYISNIKVVHDGGMETEITDVHHLVKGSSNFPINLGNLTLTTIEGIKFSIGVDPDFNHLDPSTYAQNHALAPKNPSMNWGWTAGYRFVAMEGNAGSSLSTGYEIHALGDQNYFETSVDLEATEDNGDLYINIDADYAAALKDIDVTTGVVTHGDYDEAIDLLRNFQTDVFKSTPADTVVTPTGISNLFTNTNAINVYPNPSNGLVTFSAEDVVGVSNINLYDVIGTLVGTYNFDGNSTILNIEEKGYYFIALLKDDGSAIGHSRILIK